MSAASIVNPANALTLARVPLAFAFLLAYQRGAPGPEAVGLGAALAIALAIELTDLFDGQVARRLGCVTDFGKLVDPFCDAFARLTVFFALAAVPFASGAALLPLWMPVTLLLRDLSVSFVRSVAASRGIVVAARASGKWKALVQGPVILAAVVLALGAPEAARTLVPWLGAVAVAVTLWSLADYVWSHRAVLGERATLGS